MILWIRIFGGDLGLGWIMGICVFGRRGFARDSDTLVDSCGGC